MRKIFITSFLILLSVAMISGSAYALSGVCSNCHTMHNSQDGTHMQINPAIDLTTPKGALLRGSCLGCHTGTNSATQYHFVNSTAAPTYGTGAGGTLAGGNFYWAQTNPAAGHSIAGMAADTLTAPPGYDGGRADSQTNKPGGGAWAPGTLVTCAGTWGCHGTHAAATSEMAGISGGHHANASGSLTTASTVGNSYRFLIGIHGFEDTDYEYTASDNSTDHNQYKGITRAGANLSNTSTISWLCGECHGEFHSDVLDVGAASPWLRHPTDLSLNDATGTEYAAYNSAAVSSAAPYSIVAPVGTVSVAVQKATVDVTKGAADDAVVTCISCHRAHGSPYSDLLRWNYSTIQAGVGGPNNNTGCFICHTTKD